MKRNTKISCDVSREADNMLKAYCLKHERSKGFLLEKMIRKFCSDEQPLDKPLAKPKAPKTKRKVISYPRNLDDQFLLLWDTKGKKGAKNGTKGAYNIFKKLAANVDEDTCETFTKMLIDDINKNKGECGYPEMHLTSYLNQQRWDK